MRLKVPLPGDFALWTSCSANAGKHGFFAKHAVLLNELEHRQFESLRNSFIHEVGYPLTVAAGVMFRFAGK